MNQVRGVKQGRKHGALTKKPQTTGEHGGRVNGGSTDSDLAWSES